MFLFKIKLWIYLLDPLMSRGVVTPDPQLDTVHRHAKLVLFTVTFT